MPPSYTTPRTTVVSDTECYRNYWCIAFRCVDTGRSRRFELTNDMELDRAGVAKIIRGCRIVTFNGIGYDMPMIALAMSGATTSQLKQASDDIILGDLRPWAFEEKYGVRMPDFLDHIDLMEVSPGSPQKPSLKIYAGRLHSKRMQDLPFDPDRILSPADIRELRAYHDNDLDVTVDKYRELLPQLELRAEISEMYGMDLRSKSDAQMAEAIIKAEIERITGKRVFRPDVRSGVFQYQPPDYLKFQTAVMQGVFETVRNAKFAVGYDGVVRMPESLSGLKVSIGESIYSMGIGGLHSSESQVTHRADDTMVPLDRDVNSYYPSLIETCGLSPRHLGDAFMRVYRSMLHGRLAAKKRASDLKKQISAVKAQIAEIERAES